MNKDGSGGASQAMESTAARRGAAANEHFEQRQ